MSEAFPQQARPFPTPQQLELARKQAAAIEEGMTDAGKGATPTFYEKSLALYIQLDDSCPKRVAAVDALLSSLYRSGERYSFRHSWSGGFETIEVRKLD